MSAYRDSQLGLCIDLSGPDGNAFYLMGCAKTYLKAIDYSEQKIADVVKDMLSGDYNNLVSVFEEHLGNIITLINKE